MIRHFLHYLKPSKRKILVFDTRKIYSQSQKNKAVKKFYFGNKKLYSNLFESKFDAKTQRLYCSDMLGIKCFDFESSNLYPSFEFNQYSGFAGAKLEFSEKSRLMCFSNQINHSIYAWNLDSIFEAPLEIEEKETVSSLCCYDNNFNNVIFKILNL